jgi:hypothetical protein
MSNEVLKFDAATFEALQRLVYPLVEIVFGIKIAEFVGDKSELFTKTGEAVGEISELFLVTGSALEDGIVTEEEVEQIIAQAVTVGEAIGNISSKFGE